MTQAGNSLLVAVGDVNVLGVGAVTDAGQINLLYVSPDARSGGISKVASCWPSAQRHTGARLHASQQRDRAALLFLTDGYVRCRVHMKDDVAAIRQKGCDAATS